MGFQLYMTNGNFSALPWNIFGKFVMAWLLTPLISFIISLILFNILDITWHELENELISTTSSTNTKTIKIALSGDHDNDSDYDDMAPLINSIKYPNVSSTNRIKFSISFGVIMTILALFLIEGNSEMNSMIELVNMTFLLLSFLSISGYFIEPLFKSMHAKLTKHKHNYQFYNNDYFQLFLIISSGAVSFAHGGNDISNVIGPYSKIYLFETTGNINEPSFSLPIYVSGIGGLCISLGFYLMGKNVMETLGQDIATLSYKSGFVAQFSSALTVLCCNILGLSVSSTTVCILLISI